MKLIKWKTLLITSLVCLVPILFGVMLWNYLPDSIAIHFDINNNPDNFAPKGVAVFLLPFMMAFMQAFCCVINDINAAKKGEVKKFERAVKWIIPSMSIILQAVTLAFALGFMVDIRRVAAVIVGVVLILVGNYMPKLNYVKNHNYEPDTARKINRFMGFGSVIMGVLFLISALLPPVATICALVLLVPYVIISTVYGIKVGKGK